MDYAFTIKVEKRAGISDSFTYTVIAPNAGKAIAKAMRQAQQDSGFKNGWDVQSLTKGQYVVG